MFGRSAASEEEDDLETDPIITGEPYGIGNIILQALGGLIAVPFVLVNIGISGLKATVKVAIGILEYVARLGGVPVEPPDDSDKSKPVPTKSGGD